MIEAGGDRLLIRIAGSRAEPVGEHKGIAVRKGRQGNIREDVFRKRALLIARNDVAREGSAGPGATVSRVGIVDYLQAALRIARLAEIALALFQRRHRARRRSRGAIAKTFVGEKPECAVLAVV